MDVFELVAKLSLDTSAYEQGLKGAGQAANRNLGTASKALGALNKGVNAVLKVGAVAAGAAVAGMTAFAKASVQTGMEFDSAMAQVAATMGTTVSEIGELRDFAQQMGATTAFSATQAAEALNYMALAGYDAETSMATLPTVLNLAAAGGMDLARASDMVTDAQSALGLETAETTEMVDQMAKAASKSNTSVSQLGEAFLTIGATARNLKGGTVELSTVLGVLADNGIKGAEGGTHLRNMILSLQNPTKDASKILKDMKISLYDSNGEMRSMIDIVADLQKGTEGMDQASRDAIVSGIFNKTDLASVNALLNTPIERFNELTDAIKNSKGAAEEMANTQLDNLAGDVTLLKSAAEGAKIAFSDGLTPAIRDVVQRVTKVLSKKSTQKALTDLGKKIGDVAKVLTTKLGNAIPRIASLFEDGGKKLKIFGAAFGAFVIAVKAAVNPIGAVVTAIGLLAAATGAAALTADDAKKKYSKLTDEQRDNITATLDAVDAYKDLKASREKDNESADAEAKTTRDLWTELMGLADASGKVKDEDKARAEYILGELNSALGTEYSMNGNVIEQYGEMLDSINNLIEARRAERKLAAAEDSYNTAKDNLAGVTETIYDLETEVTAAQSVLDGLNQQLTELQNKPTPDTIGAQGKLAADEAAVAAQIREVTSVLQERTAELDSAKQAEKMYHEDIQKYLDASVAAEEGNWKKVNELLDENSTARAKHLIESGKITKEEVSQLERNAAVQEAAMQRYQENLAQGTEGYTQEEYSTMADHLAEMQALIAEGKEQLGEASGEMGEQSASEYDAGIAVMPSDTSTALVAVAQSFRSNTAVEQAARDLARRTTNAFNNSLTLKVPEGGTGHAIGLDYVPYNKYPAILHRGEAVLTASEAEDWRRGEAPTQTSRDPNVEVIVELLQEIMQNGLNANVSGRALYNSVMQENRTRTRATNYNGLSMV